VEIHNGNIEEKKENKFNFDKLEDMSDILISDLDGES